MSGQLDDQLLVIEHDNLLLVSRVWECERCLQLGEESGTDGHNAVADELSPPAARGLVRFTQKIDRYLDLRRCPSCDTFYRLVVTTDADAGGAVVDVTLSRLSPAEVDELLPGLPQGDTIAAAEAALRARTPAALFIAAKWLTRHYARAASFGSVEALVSDAEQRVRDGALAALVDLAKRGDALTPSVIAAAGEEVARRDQPPSRPATRAYFMLYRFAARDELLAAVPALVRALAHDDIDVRGDATNLLAHFLAERLRRENPKPLGADVLALLPVLVDHAASPRPLDDLSDHHRFATTDFVACSILEALAREGDAGRAVRDALAAHDLPEGGPGARQLEALRAVTGRGA